VTVPVAERGSARQRSQGIGQAAVLIGTRKISTRAVTVASWLGVAVTLVPGAVLAAFLTVVALAADGDLRAVLRRAVGA
jgi:hypothetical protein